MQQIKIVFQTYKNHNFRNKKKALKTIYKIRGKLKTNLL